MADLTYAAAWLLMNVFWMWERYDVSIPLAVPTAIAGIAVLYYTERVSISLLTTGSSLSWYLKDLSWMLENAGRLPSGKEWGTLWFFSTLGCAIAALAVGQQYRAITAVMLRIKRIRLLMPSRKG